MRVRPCIFPKASRLDEAISLPCNYSGDRVLPEKVSSIGLGVRGPVSNWNGDFILQYDVFPRHILTFEAQWIVEGRAMRVGDVILQRASLPPIGWGMCMEFGVRINSLYRAENRLGFAYQTLQGHAERGESQFYFEALDGEVYFTIRTYSEPGHWTSRLAKHAFTLPYQGWCTRRALRHVKGRFHELNPHTT